MSRPQAILFDMDGLLLDSERVARECYEQTCAQMSLDPLPMADYVQLIGRDAADGRRLMVRLSGPAFPVEEFDARWTAAYQSRTSVEAVPRRPGVATLLDRTSALGIPAAVVTSTETARAEHKLQLAGLAGHFSHVVGGDQVLVGKPDPASYLRGVQLLGAEPEACWALEDSVNGVRAALAAGITTLQVPDLVPVTPEVRALGHTIIGSLDEVTALLG